MLRLGRPGGFLRGGQLRGGGFPSTTTRLLRAHSRSRVERCDQDLIQSGVDAGDLGHPGMRVDSVELKAALGVQQVAQGGLVDDAGGLGLVIRLLESTTSWPSARAWRLGTIRGCAGAGHPARCFVLVGDGHQSRKALQVLVAGERVVHAGVAGVTMQVLHGGVHRLGVRGARTSQRCRR